MENITGEIKDLWLSNVDTTDMDNISMVSRGVHKARKTHYCYYCRRAITPGNYYLKETANVHGDLETHKYCSKCIWEEFLDMSPAFMAEVDINTPKDKN